VLDACYKNLLGLKNSGRSVPFYSEGCAENLDFYSVSCFFRLFQLSGWLVGGGAGFKFIIYSKGENNDY